MAIIYGELKDAQGNVLRDKVLYDDLEQAKKDIQKNAGDITNIESNITNIQETIQNIQQTVAGSAPVKVVDNIAARDALNAESPIVGTLCWVIDASADPTVNLGAACYIWQDSGGWKKVAEVESMDNALTWESISGKELDAAVVNYGAQVPQNLAETAFYFQKAQQA